MRESLQIEVGPHKTYKESPDCRLNTEFPKKIIQLLQKPVEISKKSAKKIGLPFPVKSKSTQDNAINNLSGDDCLLHG